jgi:hypothetical protein
MAEENLLAAAADVEPYLPCGKCGEIRLPTFTVEDDGLYFTVRSGERYQDKLDRGECLDIIARLLYGSSSIERILRTEAEHLAFWDTISRKMAEHPVIGI